MTIQNYFPFNVGIVNKMSLPNRDCLVLKKRSDIRQLGQGNTYPSCRERVDKRIFYVLEDLTIV